jgi:hypothetical protein
VINLCEIHDNALRITNVRAVFATSVESAHYLLATAAKVCRFQSHVKHSGKSKLPRRYRWPDDVRDDILARRLALNAARAELERLTGLPGAARPAGGGF